MFGWVLLCLSITTVTLVGCDRGVLPYVPPEEEPPLTELPVRVPGLTNPAPKGSQLGRPADGAPIAGVIRLAPGVSPYTRGVVFVIAWPPASGHPLAVKRLQVASFPVTFEIGPADAMTQESAFAGPIRLTARFDGDGNLMTRGPNDLNGELSRTLQPGTRDVELVLAPTEG